MNYLVDTHIFLWSVISPKKIPKNLIKILNDPESAKLVSVISFWEIALKFSLKKIDLIGIFPDELPRIAEEAKFEIVNLDIKTASAYYKLPRIKNKDPFDRMLAWQAINKDLSLVTKDADFLSYKDYGLKVML